MAEIYKLTMKVVEKSATAICHGRYLTRLYSIHILFLV